MGEAITTPYDLIGIKLDKQQISARPVEWNAEFVDGEGHIADGSLATPTAFESSCPYCSQMIHFKSGFEQIKCSECGRGQDIPIFVDHPFQDPGEYTDPASIEDALDIDAPDTPLDEELKQDILNVDVEDCADELIDSIEESIDEDPIRA